LRQRYILFMFLFYVLLLFFLAEDSKSMAAPIMTVPRIDGSPNARPDRFSRTAGETLYYLKIALPLLANGFGLYLWSIIL